MTGHKEADSREVAFSSFLKFIPAAPWTALNELPSVPLNRHRSIRCSHFRWPMPGSMTARRFIRRQRLHVVEPRRRLSTSSQLASAYLGALHLQLLCCAAIVLPQISPAILSGFDPSFAGTVVKTGIGRIANLFLLNERLTPSRINRQTLHRQAPLCFLIKSLLSCADILLKSAFNTAFMWKSVLVAVEYAANGSGLS
jgi:hypothetical protein